MDDAVMDLTEEEVDRILDGFSDNASEINVVDITEEEVDFILRGEFGVFSNDGIDDTISSSIWKSCAGIYYIYVLIDPRDRSVRYVGQTNDLLRRINGHCNGRGSGVAVSNWILELVEMGWAPLADVVMTTLPQYADLAEYVCIDFFSRKGCDLLNVRMKLPAPSKERIIALRKELGLSQAAFAEEIGKSLRQVQYYESGQIDIPAHVLKLVELMEREIRFKELLSNQ